MLTPQEALIELNGKLERVIDSIDVMKERQEAMSQEISEIHKDVFEPDEGLHARLRDLENWKGTSSKLMWMLLGSLFSLGSALWIQHIL